MGAHHRRLCVPIYAQSPAYAAMWTDLRRGKSLRGTFESAAEGRQKITEVAGLMDEIQRGADNVCRSASSLLAEQTA